MCKLMNTPDELHAFVIGFSETLCPWKPGIAMPMNYLSPLKGEYHYYLAGRATGFIALLLFLIGISKLTKIILL